MKKQMKANLLLVLTAMIWGTAFVAQDVAADVLAPFTFNALRMAVGAVALMPVVCLMGRRAPQSQWKQLTPANRRTLLLGGACCGVMLSAGSAFQQLGIHLGAGAGKAGFITAMYIVLVPLLGLFSKKRIRWTVWLAVALAAVGLYFLCMQGAFALGVSDALLLACALSYAGHILVVDHFGRLTDCVKLSCLQFAFCSLLCAAMALLFEQPNWQGVMQCLPSILYVGIFSSAVGYTLQIIAQRDAEPAVASLLMSLESVFAVVGGWIILGDRLSARELFGCALMMSGIVLAQLPQKNTSRR